tara:strand:- start:26557 stop:27300 length:744 start_codon:yes stop_codon:yes gene_type:complete
MSIKKNRELMVDQITRLRGELKESVNEAMLSPKAAKKLKIGNTIKTQKGTYKITGYGQKTGATINFEAEKDGQRYNLRVSLRGTTSIEVAKGRSLNFTDSEMLESVNEARMKEDDFMDRLEDYASDVIPSKDYIKKSKRDLLKQLIGNMRTDKKAKALYTYWSKNKGKGLLDRIGSMFESVNESKLNEAKIAFLNDKLINSRIQKSGLLPLLGGNNKSLSKDKVKFTQELNSFLKKLYKKYSTLPIK